MSWVFIEYLFSFFALVRLYIIFFLVKKKIICNIFIFFIIFFLLEGIYVIWQIFCFLIFLHNQTREDIFSCLGLPILYQKWEKINFLSSLSSSKQLKNSLIFYFFFSLTFFHFALPSPPPPFFFFKPNIALELCNAKKK